MISQPRVLVASTKSIKALATGDAFRQYGFEILPESIPEDIDPGVSNQPSSLTETLRGAMNRLQICRDTFPGYDYYCAIEGGMHQVKQNHTNRWFESASAALYRSETEVIGIGFGPSFPVPEQLAKLALEENGDLNSAMQTITGIERIGETIGFNGWTTNGLINRRSASAQAVLLSLCEVHLEF
ncbi:MAG: inosine/xanthosine triphosphatase [Patescibacteria group bacterium]